MKNLSGLKTYLLVVAMLFYVGYLIHIESVSGEIGLGVMISSLIPLAVNSRLALERKRIVEEIKRGRPGRDEAC